MNSRHTLSIDHSPRLGGSDDQTARGRCGHVVCGVSKSRWARLCVHGDGSVHAPSGHLTPTSIAVTTTRIGTCKMVGSPFHVATGSFSSCRYQGIARGEHRVLVQARTVTIKSGGSESASAVAPSFTEPLRGVHVHVLAARPPRLRRSGNAAGRAGDRGHRPWWAVETNYGRLATPVNLAPSLPSCLTHQSR